MRIMCTGPGPHAPADGVLGEEPGDGDSYTGMCAACVTALPLPPPSTGPPPPDITVLAGDLASLSAAVDELILNALMGL